MLAFIDNQEKSFKDKNTQDIMADNMDHGDKIIIEMDLERKSTNTDLQELWTGANFLQSFERIVPEVYEKHGLTRISSSSSSSRPIRKNRWSKYSVPKNSILDSDVYFTNGE